VTDQHARTVANMVVASAAVAAAYVVLTTPPLRRLAIAATRLWLGASVPVFLTHQLQRAWAESGGSVRRT